MFNFLIFYWLEDAVSAAPRMDSSLTGARLLVHFLQVTEFTNPMLCRCLSSLQCYVMVKISLLIAVLEHFRRYFVILSDL